DLSRERTLDADDLHTRMVPAPPRAVKSRAARLPRVGGGRSLVPTARVTRMRGLPRSEPMRVQEVMAKDPKTCRANDTLVAAARILWDHDCGCVPVVDDQGRPVGIVTDRDACMAAYTRGRRLDEIAVHGAMAKTLFTCRADDGLAQAVALMQQKQVRRLPVGDERGRLCGGLSVADARRAAGEGRDPHGPVLGALAAIAAPRQHAPKPEAVAVVVPKAPSAPAPGALPVAAAPASAGGASGKQQDKSKKR